MMVLGGVAAGFMLYVATELMEDLGPRAHQLGGRRLVPGCSRQFAGALALLYQEDG